MKLHAKYIFLLDGINASLSAISQGWFCRYSPNGLVYLWKLCRFSVR